MSDFEDFYVFPPLVDKKFFERHISRLDRFQNKLRSCSEHQRKLDDDVRSSTSDIVSLIEEAKISRSFSLEILRRMNRELPETLKTGEGLEAKERALRKGLESQQRLLREIDTCASGLEEIDSENEVSEVLDRMNRHAEEVISEIDNCQKLATRLLAGARSALVDLSSEVSDIIPKHRDTFERTLRALGEPADLDEETLRYLHRATDLLRRDLRLY